ncbi:CHAT domain-containing protein, partial [Lacticaseibacillus rhamnosus]
TRTEAGAPAPGEGAGGGRRKGWGQSHPPHPPRPAGGPGSSGRGTAPGSRCDPPSRWPTTPAPGEARAFSGAQIIGLSGFDATASRVLELSSRELNVLHFATHAVIHKDAPGQSALFLSDTEDES